MLFLLTFQNTVSDLFPDLFPAKGIGTSRFRLCCWVANAFNKLDTNRCKIATSSKPYRTPKFASINSL